MGSSLKREDEDESFLAALDDTQYDPDQSTVFGITQSTRSTPMKSAALKVFEDADSGGNRTRDLSLSNIRCFVDMDNNADATPPIKMRSIVSGEDADTTRGGNTTAYFSGNNSTTSTSSFSGFSPSPFRNTATNGKNSAGSASRRSSRRPDSNSEQTPGLTPLTYRKGFEPNAAPARTPFAPKNENVLKSSPTKSPSPLKRENRGMQLVDPFNAAVLARQLAALDAQLRSFAGFIDCNDAKVRSLTGLQAIH